MRPPLYQVNVETVAGSVLAVGPAMLKEAAEGLLVAINAKIAEGKEREWSNPHLVRAVVN